MNREIKYRAWLKEENKMVKVLALETRDDGTLNVLYNDNMRGTLGKFAVEIMQYTGLKDSLGNEIYEGDIIWNEYDEKYGEVTFDEGEWKLLESNISQNLFSLLDVVEVKGNIYENEELL